MGLGSLDKFYNMGILRDAFTAVLSLGLGLYLGMLLPKYSVLSKCDVWPRNDSSISANMPSQAGTWQLTASDGAALNKAATLISRKGRSIADSHEAAALYRGVELRLAAVEKAAARAAAGALPALRSMRLHVSLALADAINAEARARTHSNTLILRGTLDLDPAFRKVRDNRSVSVRKAFPVASD